MQTVSSIVNKSFFERVPHRTNKSRNLRVPEPQNESSG